MLHFSDVTASFSGKGIRVVVCGCYVGRFLLNYWFLRVTRVRHLSIFFAVNFNLEVAGLELRGLRLGRARVSH